MQTKPMNNPDLNEQPAAHPPLADTTGSGRVIAGRRLTCLISNAHRLLRARYRTSPLWSLVADLTGNGSTISAEICKAAGFDPSQPCGSKYLKASAPNDPAQRPPAKNEIPPP